MSAVRVVIGLTAAIVILGTGLWLWLWLLGKYRLREAEQRKPRVVVLPAQPRPAGNTIAILCRCCNGERGDDCLCTADCGVPRCQAADPEGARRG